MKNSFIKPKANKLYFKLTFINFGPNHFNSLPLSIKKLITLNGSVTNSKHLLLFIINKTSYFAKQDHDWISVHLFLDLEFVCLLNLS